MSRSLRLMCTLHYFLGLLNVLWVAFWAWVLVLTVWHLAQRPWSDCNLWDRLFILLAPMSLTTAAVGAVLNLQAPGWIRRRERLSRLRGLALLNAIPPLSFLGCGLPVALYSAWLLRLDSSRSWFTGSLERTPHSQLQSQPSSIVRSRVMQTRKPTAMSPRSRPSTRHRMEAVR